MERYFEVRILSTDYFSSIQLGKVLARTSLGLSCRFSVRRYRIIPTYLYSHDRRRDVMSPLNMVHLYDAIFDLLKKILPEGENGRSDMFWTPLTIL